MLKQELLDILRCPKCKGDLNYSPSANTLSCKSGARVFPIRNDIPIMLVGDEKQHPE